MGTLAPEVARRTVTLMAPSKTYNIPGLSTSFAIIPDAALRRRFERAAAGIVAEVTCLGYAACEAAYRHGEPWRRALVDYLRGNRGFLAEFVARELPGVRLEAPIEATYLACSTLRSSAWIIRSPISRGTALAYPTAALWRGAQRLRTPELRLPPLSARRGPDADAAGAGAR